MEDLIYRLRELNRLGVAYSIKYILPSAFVSGEMAVCHIHEHELQLKNSSGIEIFLNLKNVSGIMIVEHE